jgi:hypothetical protein
MKGLLLACYCLLAMIAPMHFTAGIAPQTIIKKETVAMLNSTWIIESSPPETAKDLGIDFLPPGTRLQIKIEGPTRLALEEGATDELGGELILLPPFPQGICKTGLGGESGFGANLCKDGQLIDPERPVHFDSKFLFEAWKRKPDPIEDGNGFFMDQGAKIGAQFVTVVPLEKGVTWRLWVRDRNTLVGGYTATFPKDQLEFVVQTWRRAKST